MLWIILFSGFDDRGLILRNLLNVSPPSVCGIFRNGLYGTIQHCSREEGGEEKGADSISDAVVAEVHILPPHRWVTAVPAASVAGAFCLTKQLPYCGRGRELDSKLIKKIFQNLTMIIKCGKTNCSQLNP